MYSPRIDESLIPALYQLRCHRRIPMTRLVDQLIRKALANEIADMPDGIRTMVSGIVAVKSAA